MWAGACLIGLKIIVGSVIALAICEVLVEELVAFATGSVCSKISD